MGEGKEKSKKKIPQAVPSKLWETGFWVLKATLDTGNAMKQCSRNTNYFEPRLLYPIIYQMRTKMRISNIQWIQKVQIPFLKIYFQERLQKNEKQTQHPMEATVSVIVQLTYRRNEKDPRMMAMHQIEKQLCPKLTNSVISKSWITSDKWCNADGMYFSAYLKKAIKNGVEVVTWSRTTQESIDSNTMQTEWWHYFGLITYFKKRMHTAIRLRTFSSDF